MSPRYGIFEWYGEPLTGMTPARRRELAEVALGQNRQRPICPFQSDRPACQKSGGVCSMRRYDADEDGRLGAGLGKPVIMCPSRFQEHQIVVRWLAEIVGFPIADAMVAREVPFMIGTSTRRPAGMIDLVVGRTSDGRLEWYGLEIQAVYFSGSGMQPEFEALITDTNPTPPFPSANRRPDWRSSSAKRLMPQLQIKAPTLRRWATKLAVAVDRPFFDSVGGPSPQPSHDLGDGDIIWLVPEVSSDGHLVRGHWEVLTLEASSDKLLAAATVRRIEFEQVLRDKLNPL